MDPSQSGRKAMQKSAPYLSPAMRPGWHSLSSKTLSRRPRKPAGVGLVWLLHGLLLGCHLILAYLLFPYVLWGLCEITPNHPSIILFGIPTVVGFLFLWSVSLLSQLAVWLEYRKKLISRLLHYFRLLIVLVHLFEMGWVIRTVYVVAGPHTYFDHTADCLCYPESAKGRYSCSEK
jgi:hypothetical protein